jgi:site-specific recombinase XerC
MFYKNFSTPKSPLQWQEFRLNKFSTQLNKNSFSSGDSENYLEIVKEFLEQKHKMLLMLVYGFGLRLSEIRMPRPNHIDWDRNIIHINGKGSKQHNLPLGPWFKEPLRQYLKINPGLIYLFDGLKKGESYPRRTIQKIYENGCKKAEIQRRAGIHALRHRFATHLLEQRMDTRKAQVMPRHSIIKMTQIYTHVNSTEIAKIRSTLASILSQKKEGRL